MNVSSEELVSFIAILTGFILFFWLLPIIWEKLPRLTLPTSPRLEKKIDKITFRLKNIFWFPKVDNKVPPEETSISRSPLIKILTGPEGDNFCFTNNNTLIRSKEITRNATTVAMTVPVVPAAKIIMLIF